MNPIEQILAAAEWYMQRTIDEQKLIDYVRDALRKVDGEKDHSSYQLLQRLLIQCWLERGVMEGGLEKEAVDRAVECLEHAQGYVLMRESPSVWDERGE